MIPEQSKYTADLKTSEKVHPYINIYLLLACSIGKAYMFEPFKALF